jgi:LmbE family N-acetylglucosaminyl deacetylase
MDIEFICTAAWTKDIPIVHVNPGFTCHQDHQNIWESNQEAMNDNKDIDMSKIERKEKIYMNKANEWALESYDIYKHGVECVVFEGGLAW